MPPSARQVRRVIRSAAPIRICDIGGWTDTWFARHGIVFNIGVHPLAEVQLQVLDRRHAADRIVIHAENYGERFVVEVPGARQSQHPLLEAALEFMGIPDDVAIEVNIHCEAPAGGATGTSAAVSVALIGALDLLTPGRMTPHEVARAAQYIETDMLGQQCGVQDQLCSAFGGINYIEISRYPHASVSPVAVPDNIWWELERRLVVVFLGRAHSSSALHTQVIAALEGAGPEHPTLEALRQAARDSRDAVRAGDFAALGRAMTANTEAQARLHSDLVGPDARRVIELAREHGMVGWKVNGAGGDGGSLTLLGGAPSSQTREFVHAVEAATPGFRSLPISLSRHGLRRWETA